MADILTISPFEHGSYSYVVHAGLTDQLTRINLADPAVCGEFVTVPKHTAFIAYRRMLAIAAADCDGWGADDFELFVGNKDFEIRMNSRNIAFRTITWVRGEYEGARYSLDYRSAVPTVDTVSNWGRVQPTSPEEEERLRQILSRRTVCSVKNSTLAVSHRIFRHIPAGCVVRHGIKESLKRYDNPDLDKGVQAMHFLDLMRIKDARSWISCRLRPMHQIKA
jgi:hypothetical protein